MVDWLGRWTEEKDYSTYPPEKWCDMDRVANYIRTCDYVPKTNMENLIGMIIAHFEGETEDCSSEFFPTYDDDLNINMPKLAAFVEASGGFKEFDYTV